MNKRDGRRRDRPRRPPPLNSQTLWGLVERQRERHNSNNGRNNNKIKINLFAPKRFHQPHKTPPSAPARDEETLN